jgi:hypothetical protein
MGVDVISVWRASEYVGAALAVGLLATCFAPNTARAEGCADLIKEHIGWIKDNPQPLNEDRYVQFALVSNQARPRQIVTYSQGRLDYAVPWFEVLHGEARVYFNPIYFNQSLPSDKIFAVDPQHELQSVILSAMFPGQFSALGALVKQTQCVDGVMYGWEEVPPGEDPQSYAKTFFALSLKKMSEAKPVLFRKFPGLQRIPAPLPEVN